MTALCHKFPRITQAAIVSKILRNIFAPVDCHTNFFSRFSSATEALDRGTALAQGNGGDKFNHNDQASLQPNAKTTKSWTSVRHGARSGARASAARRGARRRLRQRLHRASPAKYARHNGGWIGRWTSHARTHQL